MRKKFYFLINSLEGGGAERSILTIASRLSRHHSITIITLKNSTFYTIPKGVEYIPLSGVKNNFLMFIYIPFYIVKLRKLFGKSAFDGGMSSLEIANFIHILSKRDARIAFETSIGFFTGISGFFYTLLIQWLYPKAFSIKVNSIENQYSLASYLGTDTNKISVIYNPLDEDMIVRKKQEECETEIMSRLTGKKVFITVARLIESKFHSKIIDSFSRVYTSGDTNWIYLIVGDGVERSFLERKVSDMGLTDNILFLGAQKNVFKYLNIAHYFVYASRVEGFPNVLGEAIVCGLPIITSDFKTGAKECIFGTYSEHQKLVYPYYGPNGVLLDLEDYEHGFISVYNHLDLLTQKKYGVDRFSLDSLEKSILEFVL